MARGQVFATKDDLAAIHKAQQLAGEQVKDNFARLRAEMNNNGPGAIGEVLNRLALDISGMRAEFAQLRANVLKIHDEALAGTGAIRGDIAPIAANIGETRRIAEASTATISERFDLSHARLATAVAEAQAEASEGISGLRVAFAALRSEVAALPITVQAETAAIRKESETTRVELQQLKIDLMVEIQTHHHSFAQWRQGEYPTMRRDVGAIRWLVEHDLFPILTRPPWWRRILRRRTPATEVEEQTDG